MGKILKNQPNFRDLGGAITRSGLTVTKNKLFRSGHLGKIDELDLRVLKKLNITTILDLRTTSEIDLIGKGSYPEFIEYQQISLNAGNITKLLIPIFEKGEFHLLESNTLEKIYLSLITQFTSEIAAVYRKILAADEGLVYHCSHGKDRTGLISALLLDFFEVDRAFIYTDYLLSNELLKRANEYQIQMIKDNFTKRFNRVVTEEEFAPVKSLFYCREELLKGVFEHIDSEYGTIQNYFQSRLGLSESELELLKSKYLE